MRTKLSETIHDCVVEALRFPHDKRAHRFFHMDPEDCSTRRVGPTPTRSSRNNAASRALQVRLGFVEVYRYWYRLQS